MSEFVHKPVLLAEVLAHLKLRPGGCYFDGTIGGGSHAEAILRGSEPDGSLFGCDRDSDAVRAAQERLQPFSGRFQIREATFRDMAEQAGPGRFDGALLDLGVSSYQLDRAERGFSFQQDGPLDMRMSRGQTMTAADLINESPVEELAAMFWELGQERQSRRFARAIERERQVRPFRTTRQLAELMERLAGRGGQRVHPATRVFQALRMTVNDELGELRNGLKAVWKAIRPGGRLLVISFHSLEDRVVKQFARELERDYRLEGTPDLPEFRVPARPELRLAPRKAIPPSEAEIRENPRARSAQLRVMEKIEHG